MKKIHNLENQEVIRLGADPRVNFCMESPIYASAFYDNTPQIFKHRLYFDGGSEHIFLPSFDDYDLAPLVPWGDRKFLCMVMANKHYSSLGNRFSHSPTFQMAMRSQLHDFRYGAIEYFTNHMKRDDFHLYGNGYLEDRSIGDKLSTIRDYKFSLCFENGAYPGYVTEKIIDCLVAGVMPIYMGAPDIGKYIPRTLFIDASESSSFEDLKKRILEIDNLPLIYKFPIEAREWLNSKDGRQYNCKSFASKITDLCA